MGELSWSTTRLGNWYLLPPISICKVVKPRARIVCAGHAIVVSGTGAVTSLGLTSRWSITLYTAPVFTGAQMVRSFSMIGM